MEGPPPPVVTRPRRENRWRKRPTWLRHLVYWVIALGVISLTAFDRSTAPGSAPSTSGVVYFAWFGWLVVVVILYAITGLISTLRGWEQFGAARTTSRSLVLFTCLLGFVAVALFYARRWGVHIEACRTVGDLETCGGPASPQQVLGMLAWHAANVVPVLDITGSLEWHRPARSADLIVGTSVIALRLWVAIGILGVLKRLWDTWEKGGSRPAGQGS